MDGGWKGAKFWEGYGTSTRWPNLLGRKCRDRQRCSSLRLCMKVLITGARICLRWRRSRRKWSRRDGNSSGVAYKWLLSRELRTILVTHHPTSGKEKQSSKVPLKEDIYVSSQEGSQTFLQDSRTAQPTYITICFLMEVQHTGRCLEKFMSFHV